MDFKKQQKSCCDQSYGKYIYERSINAKKNFLEAVQNMDLLLAAFTEGIQRISSCCFG